jgi:RNA polymerase sigma-70 factor, ECF subfamily
VNAVADHVAEKDLAFRAAQGERSAQRELFLAQRRNVHYTLFRILGGNHEIEDIVQDAFVEIFRSLASYRGDSSLTRWCATIATRAAYAAIDRRRRTPRGDPDDAVNLVAGAPGAEAQMIAHAATRRLYHALDQIDAKQRIAFALAVIDERSLQEVAELTDASLSAVKTRVFRARKELLRRAVKDPLLQEYVQKLTEGAS